MSIDRDAFKAENKKTQFEEMPMQAAPMSEKHDHRPVALVAGTETGMYSSKGIARAFEEAGFLVSYFDWQQVKYMEGREFMVERLIAKASFESPKIIFLHLQSPDSITASEVKTLAEYGFVINFTEDVRHDLSWYESLAPHIGLTLFTNIDDANMLHKKGFPNAAYIPSSFDPQIYKKTKKSADYLGDIVFIGNRYDDTNLDFEMAKQRTEMVEIMQAEFGDRFVAYGRGFPGGIVNPQQEIQIYNNCKIAITHNNFFRGGYTSDRLFRAMGCGAFVISQYFPGINQHFNNHHLGAWMDLEMLKDSCHFFLKNQPLRESIAIEGYRHVHKNHRWFSRISAIQRLIEVHSPKK